jgi:hypothetical protein
MPNPLIDPIRIAEHLHGHLGWLAAAALLHPAILLRNAKRRAHLAVASSVGLVTLVGAVGVSLYDPYRDRLKQQIFIHAPRIGYLFERKEHFAFGAIVLAWAGAAAYVGSRRAEGGVHASLRTFAFRAFVLAAAMAAVTAALGTVVASYSTF